MPRVCSAAAAASRRPTACATAGMPSRAISVAPGTSRWAVAGHQPFEPRHGRPGPGRAGGGAHDLLEADGLGEEVVRGSAALDVERQLSHLLVEARVVPANRLLDHVAEHQTQQGVVVAHEGGVEPQHEDTPLRLVANQSLGLEGHQPLANRDPTHPQRRGDLALHHAIARAQCTLPDEPADVVGHASAGGDLEESTDRVAHALPSWAKTSA